MAELTRIHSASFPDAVNVVFIHGLGGHARHTWMHDATNAASLWPTWVGEDTNSDVWILSYDAEVSGWTDAAMHLSDQGTAFLSALLYEKALRGKPLVLVAHSLGGLVIKAGIVQAATLRDARFKPLLDALEAVVFVGTPHQGSKWATAASALAIVLRTNPQVINMSAHDPWLKMLNGQFLALLDKSEFKVAVFFETQGVLIGKKVLGLSLGIRQLIVDRNSSDPNVPNVTPTPVAGDHIQIAKPENREATIHKALVSLIEDIKKKRHETLPAQEQRPSVASTAALLQKFQSASLPLLTWPTTLPDGSWLDRPELHQLDAELTGNSSSLTLLLGEAGSGKSALLARAAQMKVAAGWPVLAIKADRLPPEIVSAESLAVHLEIGTDPVGDVRAIATEGPVLVVLDQLDALADLVVQHSARLRVLLDFIRDLAGVENVHVLTSCRTFEQRHDPSLRNLNAMPITLQLPSWEAVQGVLESRGIYPQTWNHDLKGVLRSPHALDTFLSLLVNGTEFGLLRSFQGMLQLQWEKDIVSDESGGRKQTLFEIGRLMAEREVLGLPLAVVEHRHRDIQELTAIGILRCDQGAGRVEFRHQTLYEFVRARSFIEEAGTLTDAVTRNQSNLRIRPQLWHALAYFRTASPENYGDELVTLWSASLRPHLRMLLIEFMGKQVIPLGSEIQVVFQRIDDQWFKPRFLSAAIGSAGWLAVLSENHIPTWMALASSEAEGVVPLLAQGLSANAQLVRELVAKYWLPDRSKDLLSWRVLALGSVAPQSPDWVRDLESIALRTPLSDWTLGNVARIVSASLPDEAPSVVASWLRRELDGAKAAVAGAPFSELDKNVTKVEKAQAILRARTLYGLPTIAEAAPKAFILAIWPIFVDALTMLSVDKHEILVGFKGARGFLLDPLDDTEEKGDWPLLEGIKIAVIAWATSDPGDFFDFAEANSQSELLLPERLLAKGIEHCASAFPQRALTYLRNDPRRLVLGPYSDVHKETVSLIRAVAPFLNGKEFEQLTDMVTGWDRYKAEPQGEDVATKQQRLRWSREHRLRLLRALPKDRCSATLIKHIAEEERAFPRLPNWDIDSSGGQWIGSPVSTDQMSRASDDEILNLFATLPDSTGWDHPRDQMKGGAIQAGRELAGFAKSDLAKTLRVVRRLTPGLNEIPVGIVLRELPQAGYPSSELFGLVNELDCKGFASESFREAAAYAVYNAIDAENSAPESILTLLEGWIAPLKLRDVMQAPLEKEAHAGSILWNGGQLSLIPSGNYPIFAALTEGYLRQEPKQVERWLALLRKHVQQAESVDVWIAMLGSQLANLYLADRPDAESFLSALFDSYPELIRSPECAKFIARSYSWASATRVHEWLVRFERAEGADQALGELAVWRLAAFPAERWAGELIATALKDTTEKSERRKIGVAHATAHLWSTPTARPVVQPLLLQLLTSAELPVLQALDHIFLGDGFRADSHTRQLLDALTTNTGLLTQAHAERLPEILERLVDFDPTRVASIANALVDVAGDQMASMATSWYLSTSPLLTIALKLQDLGEAHRSAGSALFERMLEFNLPQAHELTLELDKRMAVADSARPAMRPVKRTTKHRGSTAAVGETR
jgi:hypothetical protein